MNVRPVYTLGSLNVKDANLYIYTYIYIYINNDKPVLIILIGHLLLGAYLRC